MLLVKEQIKRAYKDQLINLPYSCKVGTVYIFAGNSIRDARSMVALGKDAKFWI